MKGVGIVRGLENLMNINDQVGITGRDGKIEATYISMCYFHAFFFIMFIKSTRKRKMNNDVDSTTYNSEETQYLA